MESSLATTSSIHFVHFQPLIINLLLVFQLKNKKEKERMACFSAYPIRQKRTTAKPHYPSVKEHKTSSLASHWMKKSLSSLTQPLQSPNSVSPGSSGGRRLYTALPTLALESISMELSRQPLASLKSFSPLLPSIPVSGIV